MSYGSHPYELGYVAGIIDGEGYIRRPSCGRTIEIKVKMTDLDVLERCKRITGVGSISGPYVPSNGNKPQWTWAIGARDSAALAMTIYPLMSDRRQERIREALLEWRKRPLRNVRYNGPSDDRRCGTYAGFGRHLRMGTPPCGPCRDAENAYKRQRWADGLRQEEPSRVRRS